MKCKIDNCDRDAIYAKQMVCQKHYFRFMRNKSYELTSKRKYRTENKAKYQLLYDPTHPLSNKTGYVYEHRMIIYTEFKDNLPPCMLCGKNINWKNCHIDHIDNDVTNNNRSNLRQLCNGCNTSRTYRSTAKSIEIDGVTLSLMQWSRHDKCNVSYVTIKRRLDSGFTNYDAVFSKKKTHVNVMPVKTKIKYNDIN